MPKLRTEHAKDARNGALLIEAIMTRVDDLPGVFGKPDYKRVRGVTARVISDPQYALFVSYEDDEPILFVAGYLTQELHNFNRYGCIDVVLAADSSKSSQFMAAAIRNSFDQFAQWAFKEGAKRITVGHTSMSADAKTIGKLLKRWGYTSVGELFVLEAP